MAVADETRQPWLVRLGRVAIAIAATINLGGVLGATLAGNNADVDRYGPFLIAYLALFIAIDARWPRTPRERRPSGLDSDDREGPPVRGDTR